MNSKSNEILLTAYRKGYRVVDGKVISPFRAAHRRLRKNTHGYYSFCIRHEGLREVVLVHRLAAFQKYGNAVFDNGLEVRHLDGNKLNNLEENIVLGTHSENQLDKPKEMLKRDAINASTKVRKFTDLEMEEIRKFHRGSYKETMEEFDISSKGTLHYILNTKYQTKVG